MTFRLLVLLVAFVGTSAVIILFPAAPAITLARLSLGLGVATVVASGVAAWSLAEERTAGRAGWLVSRSVGRGTYLVGWFWALSAITVGSILGAGTLGWLALFSLPLRLDGAAFVTTMVAIGATAGAAIACGLAAGAVLRSALAFGLAVVVCAGLGVTAWLLAGSVPALPGAAYLLLGELGSASVLPSALRAAGVGLLLAAVLLGVARVAIERAEL
jgi:hypothetical protein